MADPILLLHRKFRRCPPIFCHIKNRVIAKTIFPRRLIRKDAPYSVVSMKEAGITADIVEDGTTFEENALIKARADSVT